MVEEPSLPIYCTLPVAARLASMPLRDMAPLGSHPCVCFCFSVSALIVAAECPTSVTINNEPPMYVVVAGTSPLYAKMRSGAITVSSILMQPISAVEIYAGARLKSSTQIGRQTPPYKKYQSASRARTVLYWTPPHRPTIPHIVALTIW